MAENNFKGTVEALFHGMDAAVSSKTVVGDAIHRRYDHLTAGGCVICGRCGRVQCR